MLSAEALLALRAGLPRLARAQAPSSDLRAFCRIYGLDFSAGFPATDYTAGTVDSGPYSLLVHRWQQTGARANLLLVHGYFDHSGLFSHLVHFGLAQGCNVVVFDLPGHGLSSGEEAVIDDFAEYGAAVADVVASDQLPNLPRWALGQSTGCAALIEYARSGAPRFDRTVLLAPLLRPTAWPRVRLARRLLQPFTDRVTRRFAENSSDRAFLEFLQHDPLQPRYISVRWVAALERWLASLDFADLGAGPALVVQGDHDGTVDWRWNLPRIGRLFPGSDVVYVEGAGHHLANEAPQLREDYCKVIARYLGS